MKVWSEVSGNPGRDRFLLSEANTDNLLVISLYNFVLAKSIRSFSHVALKLDTMHTCSYRSLPSKLQLRQTELFFGKTCLYKTTASKHNGKLVPQIGNINE